MRYAFVAYAFFISQIASAHDPVHLTNHNLLQETLGSPARPAMQDKTAYGGQEIGVPSVIRVKGRWLSEKGGKLVFESVLAQIAKLHVKKSFEQRTAHLKSWRETQEDSAGLSAPSLGKDSLMGAMEGLAGSEHPMDTGAAALSSVSELLRLYTDGRGVLMNGLAGVPDLLSRYTTVSFTVSKDQSSFDESVAQPSVLDSVELLFEGPSTHLEGIITAKRLVVLSDKFTTGAGESTSRSSASQQSGSVSINLLNLTALPGVSYSESSEKTERRSHLPSSIKIDDLYIRVKDMVVKGTTIQAKLVDAIVEGNLTIEALMGWFHREADSFAISSSGDVRVGVQERTLQQIDAAASLIGTEEFYLTVGGTLLTKSATFGLRPIGVVAEPGAERINAGRIIEEQLQEIDRDENMVINIPLGTIMTLAGQLNTIQKLKSATFDQLLEEGLTEDEAAQGLVEFQDALDPETKKAIETLEDAAKKVEKPLKQMAAKEMVAQGKGNRPSASSPNLPEGLYEAISGKATGLKSGLPDGAMSSDGALPDPTMTQKTLSIIADANEQLQDFAEKNPQFAATATRLLEWGGAVAQAWTYVQAAGAGLVACSPGGPVASGVCAVGAVYLVHKGGEAAASGLGQGVKALSKAAAKQGRNVKEAERFANAATNTAENLLEGLSLMGLKKGAKKVFGKHSPVTPYEVGTYSDLSRRSKKDAMEIHHVPQQQGAKQAIEGYEPVSAPSIVLPAREHKKIPNVKGTYSGTGRELLAKDLKNLRNYTNAPNKQIMELSEMAKKTYPKELSKVRDNNG